MQKIWLMVFLAANSREPVSGFSNDLIRSLNAFKAGDIKDDICVMDILIKGQSAFLGWHKH